MNTEHRTTEGEIKEIWERLTKGEASIKSAHHRIDQLQDLGASVKELAIATAQIAAETKALREDYADADKRLDTLEEKPAKRFDLIITTFITALCSGLAGYLLSAILK